MKKNCAAILFLLVTMPCCKKQSIAEENKLDIITTGVWRVSGHIVYTITDGTDLYSIYPDCRKDDYRQFKKDGTAEINEGHSKCNSTDPQFQVSN